MTEDIELWERQPDEPSRAFHAFSHYRNLTVRSVDRAWREHKKTCDLEDVPDDADGTKRWSVWSATYGWVERAAAWDAEVDRLAREKLVKQQIEARERHARLAQGALTALTVPVRALLDGLQKHPDALNKLGDRVKDDPDALVQLVAIITRASQAIPGLIAQERLALGLVTESVQVDDLRDSNVIANAIAGDPTATEMAIGLLDRLAGTGPGTPVGPGTPSVPRQLADRPASEPADEEAGGPGTAAAPSPAGDDPGPSREE